MFSAARLTTVTSADRIQALIWIVSDIHVHDETANRQIVVGCDR